MKQTDEFLVLSQKISDGKFEMVKLRGFTPVGIERYSEAFYDEYL